MDLNRVLITGAAGFIGFHLCQKLLNSGQSILGIDNLNSYYDPLLKRGRLRLLEKHPKFHFNKVDLCDSALEKIILDFNPQVIIHLAAQAGVRYSLENPEAYVQSNVMGTLKLLEVSRHLSVKHFIYASSSSVYGANKSIPFQEADRVDQPMSLYAVTKRTNELTAQVYSQLYNLPLTGLRFFTVYGSWGRPDMAYFSFTKKILNGDPISLYNNGNLKRDFTHVSDIVESIARLIPKPPVEVNDLGARHQILNIGAHQPVPLLEFIETIEQLLDKKAVKEYLPMQKGDVFETYADVSKLEQITGYKPQVSLKNGLKEFMDWYLSYYESTDQKEVFS